MMRNILCALKTNTVNNCSVLEPRIANNASVRTLQHSQANVFFLLQWRKGE